MQTPGDKGVVRLGVRSWPDCGIGVDRGVDWASQASPIAASSRRTSGSRARRGPVARTHRTYHSLAGAVRACGWHRAVGPGPRRGDGWWMGLAGADLRLPPSAQAAVPSVGFVITFRHFAREGR